VPDIISVFEGLEPAAPRNDGADVAEKHMQLTFIDGVD
jgi:hypothetical protein